MHSRERTLVTHLVAGDMRSDLGKLDGHWAIATAAATVEREAKLALHAMLVVASWLDERFKPQVRCWLRGPAERDGPIVVSVGYHEYCDVRDVYGASLRHALIVADPALRPGVVDVIDLNTEEGLRADGERGLRRLQSLGAQRFGAGSADILAILLEPGEGVQQGLLRAGFAGAVDLAPKPVLDLRRRREASDFAARCELSRAIGSQPPRVPLKGGGRSGTSIARSRDQITQIAGDAVEDQNGRRKMVVRPSAQELANGFLIGRYPRCAVRSDDVRMSRVHALVMGRRDGMLVADAGSTNGTVLVDGDTGLELDRGHRALIVQRGARLFAGDTEIEIVTGA